MGERLERDNGRGCEHSRWRKDTCESGLEGLSGTRWGEQGGGGECEKVPDGKSVRWGL